MHIKSPTEYGAGPGDIVHVRTQTVFGWGIRLACPGSWGNHDGILVFDASRGWGVAEALLNMGFIVTPWEVYALGEESLVFMRPIGISDIDRIHVVDEAYKLEELHPKYDRLAIVSIALSIILKKTINKNREWKWYCTEAVKACYGKVGWDIWQKVLPTPYTTEKRQKSGKLEIRGEFYPKKNALKYKGN